MLILFLILCTSHFSYASNIYESEFEQPRSHSSIYEEYEEYEEYLNLPKSTKADEEKNFYNPPAFEGDKSSTQNPKTKKKYPSSKFHNIPKNSFVRFSKYIAYLANKDVDTKYKYSTDTENFDLRKPITSKSGFNKFLKTLSEEDTETLSDTVKLYAEFLSNKENWKLVTKKSEVSIKELFFLNVFFKCFKANFLKNQDEEKYKKLEKGIGRMKNNADINQQ